MTTGATPDLASRFAEFGSEVISVDGREVRALLRLDVRPGEILEVTRLTASGSRPQALKLAIADGNLVAAATTAPSIGLWTTTAPHKVQVEVLAPGPTSVDIWNSWRYGGLDHAWIGNAGMVVTSGPRSHTIECSDGVGPAHFADLVVTVQILGP